MGFIYMAMGGIVIQTLMGIMTQSRLGERVMMKFSRRVEKSLKRLGASLAKILEPILNVVASLLEIATANPIIRDLVAYVGLGIAVFITFAGVVNIVKGAMAILGVTFSLFTGKVATSQTVLTMYTGNAITATGATWTLATALQAVIAGFAVGFGLVMAINAAFGRLPAIIAGVTTAVIALAIALWSAAGGLSVLTFGAAAVAGGAAIATAIVASQPEYAMGTSFVRQTGYARVHRGEEIKSARESRVTPRMDRTFQTAYTKTYSPTTIHIHGDLYTRSDKETMMPAIRRALKDEIDNKA